MRFSLSFLALVALAAMANADDAAASEAAPATCEAQQAQLLEAERTIAQLQEKLDAVKATASDADSRVAALTAERDGAINERTALALKITNLEGTVESLSKTGSQAKSDTAACKAKLAAQAGNIEDLKATVKNSKAASCPTAGDMIQSSAEEYASLALEALQSGKTAAVALSADVAKAASPHWAKVRAAVKDMHATHLAKHVDPVIASASEALAGPLEQAAKATEGHRAQFADIVQQVSSTAQTKASAGWAAARAGRAHYREQVIATMQKEHRLAGHAEKLVCGIEYSVLILAVLLVGLPLLRLAVRVSTGLVRFVLSTTFCILTLGWCCGACASRSPASGATGAKKSKKKKKKSGKKSA